MQSIYWVCVLITCILLYFSYKHDDKIIFKILAFGVISFRNTIRLFDFENSKFTDKDGNLEEYDFESDSDGLLIVMNKDTVLTLGL